MKNVIRFISIVGTFVLVYYAGDRAMQYFNPQNQSIADASLLFIYGGMTGYILLIIFVVILQKNNYDQLKIHKPKLGRMLYNFHIFIALLFIAYAIISFNIQFAVLMVLIFLFVTTVLDFVREKMIQEIHGNTLHPKKIL